MRTNPLAVARDLASARSWGRCEGCGAYVPLDPHHRAARGMGGVGAARATVVQHVANLIMLCRPCHLDTEHADHWRECASKGWRLRSGEDPQEVPALLYTPQGYGWWYLTADGGYRYAHIPATMRRELSTEENACPT